MVVSTSRLSSHLALGLAAVVASLFFAACKQNAAPKVPQKQGAEANPNEDEDFDDLDDLDDLDDGNGGGSGLDGSLSIAPSAPGQSWSFPTGQSISINFALTGAEGKDIQVALKDKPAGATVSKTNSSVTVTWSSPTAGKHPLSFILRDMEICEEAESNASACTLSDSSTPNSSYDVTSQSWEFDITTGTTVGGTGGTGGAGGGNAALIQQITALLGGGGGDITGLLNGLGAGDLTQILQGAQGGNLDINSLLSQLGG